MIFNSMTNAELLRYVDNTPSCTDLERELAQRVAELTGEVGMLQHLANTRRQDYDHTAATGG